LTPPQPSSYIHRASDSTSDGVEESMLPKLLPYGGNVGLVEVSAPACAYPFSPAARPSTGAIPLACLRLVIHQL